MVTLLLVLACATTETDPGKDTAPGGDTAADTGDTGDTGPDPDTLDQDGDGYRPLDGDCDDRLPHVYPGAPDYCDGLDQDCDGEPIPAGSCGQEGDAAAMWSWSSDGSPEKLSVSSSVGDVDGDGRIDLPISYGSADAAGTQLGARLSRQSTELDPTWLWTERPYGPLLAGDTDADGYADAWRVSQGHEYGLGLMYLHRGSATGLAESAAAEWVLDYGLVQLSYAPGDYDGDGASDQLVYWLDELADASSHHLAVIGGDVGFLGGSDFDAYPHTIYDLPDYTNVSGYPTNVGDLDGDGSDEIAATARYEQLDPKVLVVVSGIDLARGGASFSDLAVESWTDIADGYLELTSPEASANTDLDGDGLADLEVAARRTESDSCSLYYVSGGIPDGPLAAATHTTLEQVPQSGRVLTRDADADGDGVADSVLWNNCLLPSARLTGGGTFAYDEVAGPCATGHSLAYVNVFADMTGDGLPEWVFNDLYGNPDGFNRVLIIEGFPIPWDDPAKW